MSKKYRKKPVVVEAVELTKHNIFHVLTFMGERPDLTRPIDREKFGDYQHIVAEEGMEIYTLEGVMTASIGDFIIKGVSGEFYPCKPKEFALTYEEV